MNQEIDKVVSFITACLSARGATIPMIGFEDFNYIDSGSLDSFEILSFIIEIEKEFAIKLTLESLQEERIKTVGGIASMIVEKLGTSCEKND